MGTVIRRLLNSSFCIDLTLICSDPPASHLHNAWKQYVCTSKDSRKCGTGEHIPDTALGVAVQ